MTDTTLTDPLRAAGASVINAMAEVQLLVLSLDPLWQGIGGRPVSIESAWSALDYQKRALTELSERGALVRVAKGPRRWVFDTADGEPNALECELLEMIYGADFENVTT